MEWFEAKRLPLALDLAPVLRSMQRANIPCWISEDAGEQVIWLASEAHRAILAQTLQAQSDGILQVPLTTGTTATEPSRSAFNWRGCWVTLLALILSALGGLLVYLDVNLQWVHWLTFTNVLVRGNSLYFTDLQFVLEQQEYWRLLTPIFLHFGLFHILFNGLWLWEMGRRIEVRRGAGSLMVITLLTGIASNLLQYAMSGPSFFGGMSGVLYGYLGYIWMWQKYHPSEGFGLHSGVIGFMLLWLVVCFTGLVDGFIDGQVANGAHLGGLLCGICLGLFGVITRKLEVQRVKKIK
ncbi:rhomboid family intramembrane serine protease [Simiduia curdlanivorans]|uniref:Rhomboid family intramembrane serine protease n=1 Tax=Simiduia curdlanivorans TaxID=1492769 RepID=A0ABV8V8A1_9GAMM|nr:rhomboid family intramembrane serine protease [Simiduia curdlanivorans]MDN3639528.1 rhomboid family intramembrane serine protease [Simiduia curdlanivorans]